MRNLAITTVLIFGTLSTYVLASDVECNCPDISAVEAQLSECNTQKTDFQTQQQTHQRALTAANDQLTSQTAECQVEKDKLEGIGKVWMTKTEEVTAQLEEVKAKQAEACGDKTAALQKDWEELKESRLHLASELETTKSTLSSSNVEIANLKTRIDEILLPQVDEMVNCKKSKAALKEELEAAGAECRARVGKLEEVNVSASGKLEKCKQQCTKDIADARKAAEDKVKPQLAEVKKLRAEVDILKEKEDLTLFSTKQFSSAFNRCQVFTRCLARFIFENVSRAVFTHVPEKWITMAKTTWDVQWKKFAPIISDMWMKVQTHHVTKMSGAFYINNVKPKCTVLMTQILEHVQVWAMVGWSYATSCILFVNSRISEYVVAPMSRRFPEMQHLVPATFLDRIFCLAYVWFVYLHLLRHARCAIRSVLAVLLFPFKLICCSRGTTSTSSSKEKKAKRSKPKTFQPAAMSTAPVKSKDGSFARDATEKENHTTRKAKGAKI